jgi:hypothetical protein
MYMCIYLLKYLKINVYTPNHVYVNIHLCTCICIVCRYICINPYIYIHIYTHIYIFISTYTFECMKIHIHCMYINIYIYLCMIYPLLQGCQKCFHFLRSLLMPYWTTLCVYVFYVGRVDKSSLYETLFHCNILSKHHHHRVIMCVKT